MQSRRAAPEPTPTRTLLWLMLAVLLLQYLGALPPELTVRRHHHDKAAGQAHTGHPGDRLAHVQSALPFKGTVRAFEWPWTRHAGTAAHAHDGHWHVHDGNTTSATPLGQPGDDAGSATGALWLGLLYAGAPPLPALALTRRFGPTLVLHWRTRSAAPPLKPPRQA